MARNEERTVEVVVTSAVVVGVGQIASPGKKPVEVTESVARDLLRRGKARLANADDALAEDLELGVDVQAIRLQISQLPPEAFKRGNPDPEVVRKALGEDGESVTDAEIKAVWADMRKDGYKAPTVPGEGATKEG